MVNTPSPFVPVVDELGQVQAPVLYDIVLTDCPWNYYGSAQKDAAAGKHYSLIHGGWGKRLAFVSWPTGGWTAFAEGDLQPAKKK